MDMLGSIVGNIIPSVGKYWNYHKEADQHEKNLKRKQESLESREDDIKTKLDSELRQGKIPKQEVKLWLRNVETVKGEIDIGPEPARWMFFSLMWKGEFAFKKTKEVEELYQAGDFTDGLVLDLPERIGNMMPPSTLVGESTAQRTKKEIIACLLDNNVGKIGVYGMGGIGKTTVMKEVNNFLLNESNRFEIVIWVTVSKEFDLIKLQNDIARRLKLKLPKFEDEIIRAMKLYTALKDRRYVLILDDLWETFALEKVGIPEPTSANECKIVLTTRDLNVCLKMGCKNIKMEILSEKEARELFLHIIEKDVFNTPILKAIAEEVLQTCARLPLAIVTIAGSFKQLVHDYEWRDALEQLRTSLKGFDNIEKQVHEVLKFSYERLKEEKLKQCLLHCALYPEDFKIYKEELIEHLIDEKIIDRMKSRQAEFDRGYSMLSKLENACLLEGVIVKYYKEVKFVKMHDLVRDMVLEVAGPQFMAEGHQGLEDFSNEEIWREDLVKASLMYKGISTIPSNVSPRCPNLSTLLLQGNEYLNVPDSLFKHLHGLKVLDLSDTLIESLPNSVFSLENLTTLRLRECTELEHVSSLAKLTTLRKLDLSLTRITKVPDGLEMLVNLTYLNLEAWDIKIMPLGILSKLSHLQYLRFSYEVTVKGEEMKWLKKLENVWVRFDDLYEFCTFIRSLEKRRLACYQIQVGKSVKDDLRDIQDVGKGVILEECNLGRGGESLVLPEDVQSLEIVEWHDLTSLYDVPSLKHVRELKKICLNNCKGIEHVLSSSSITDSLQTLEILELRDLDNLRELFRKERVASAWVPPNTFSCLQKIAIERAPNIKKLLPLGLLLPLCNLKEIYVSECEQVEEIIGEASDEFEEEEKEEEGMDTTKITLPNLRVLRLNSLRELKTICSSSKVIVCDSLEKIEIHSCSKLKRLPLSLPLLNAPGLLLHLRNLKEICVSECGLEEIIGEASDEFEEEEIEEEGMDTTKITLLNLRVLRLYSLWELKTICSSSKVIVCDSLEMIRIHRCPKLKRLPLSLPLLNAPGLLLQLHNLKEIHVSECEQVEEIIGEASDEFEEEEEKEEEGMDTTKITLPNLKVLRLCYLWELKTICSSSKVIVCDSLEMIEIKYCPNLKRLPLSLPLLNGQLSPPSSLQHIKGSKEWWESLEWDSLDTKNVLQPFFRKF